MPGLHCLLLVIVLLLREHVLGYLLWNTLHCVRCSKCWRGRSGGWNETCMLCIWWNWNVLMFPSCSRCWDHLISTDPDVICFIWHSNWIDFDHYFTSCEQYCTSTDTVMQCIIVPMIMGPTVTLPAATELHKKQKLIKRKDFFKISLRKAALCDVINIPRAI